MYQEHRIGAILLMGGSGLRFGGTTLKQFCNLADKPLWRYALETFLETKIFDEIILVCHPDWMNKVIVDDQAQVVKGGKTRQASSRLGLQGFRRPPDIVVIHDAVRPFVSQEIVIKNIEAAIQWGAVDTCIPTTDTLVYTPTKEWIESIPNREEFLKGQTPQTFRYELIVEAHERAFRKGMENATDDCRLILEMGKQIHIVQGDDANLKITSEFDLILAEALLSIKKQKIQNN